MNTAQSRACRIVDGPALVIAGAGTGKTHTLTKRLVYLIKEKNIQPENILVLTFTNKASQEMRERAEGELGKGTLKNLTLGTFHQLGLKIIRQEIEKTGLNPDFVIDTDLDRERHGKTNALSFDDLILLPLSIFKKYPEALQKYQKAFTYILVDEYQDIDQPQYELLKLLASSHHNLWAIGDSDQAIYSFRGGNLENFLAFEKDYPGAQSVTLGDNYRSTEIIIRAGQSLIEKNTKRVKKELNPTIKGGENISLFHVPDEKAEGKTIIREIEKYLGGTSHYEIYRSGDNLHRDVCYGKNFSDFAVLYRLNSQGQALANVFDQSGIPYQLINKQKKDSKETPEDTLLRDIDFYDCSADTVTLMTLHSAKGLEFPIVFITGLEDGILPYKPSHLNLPGSVRLRGGIGAEEYEEERRLFYVGITRAREKLYLIFAKSRFLFGERKSNPASPFIGELPIELIDRKNLCSAKRKSTGRQLSFWEE